MADKTKEQNIKKQDSAISTTVTKSTLVETKVDSLSNPSLPMGNTIEVEPVVNADPEVALSLSPFADTAESSVLPVRKYKEALPDEIEASERPEPTEKLEIDPIIQTILPVDKETTLVKKIDKNVSFDKELKEQSNGKLADIIKQLRLKKLNSKARTSKCRRSVQNLWDNKDTNLSVSSLAARFGGDRL